MNFLPKLTLFLLILMAAPTLALSQTKPFPVGQTTEKVTCQADAANNRSSCFEKRRKNTDGSLLAHTIRVVL